MIENSSHQYHLLIRGLVSDHDIPGQFRALIADLSLARGSKVRRVSHLSHSVTSYNGDFELWLQLSFGNGYRFNEDIAQSFCAAVMHPASDTILSRFSSYGLLGFSAVEGPDFSECWNMTVLTTAYVGGSKVFEKSQRRAFSPFRVDIIPEWLKVVSFVANTDLLNHFSINPALIDKGKLAFEALEASLGFVQDGETESTSKWSWAGKDNLALNLLKKLANDKSKSQVKGNAREAMLLFFDSVNDVSRSLRLAYDDNELTSERHRQIFKNLYALTVRACDAFTSNDELILVYEKFMVSHAVSATISAATAVGGGISTYKFIAQRAAVQPEGFFTKIGRGVGLVTKATPEMVKKNLATQALFSGAMTAWNLYSVGASVYKIVESKERRDHCTEAANLIWQTFLTAAETIIFMRWIYCSNGQFHFVDHCGEKWEEILKEKLGEEPEQEWKSAEYVRIYLNEQHKELKEIREGLRISTLKVYE